MCERIIRANDCAVGRCVFCFDLAIGQCGTLTARHGLMSRRKNNTNCSDSAKTYHNDQNHNEQAGMLASKPHKRSRALTRSVYFSRRHGSSVSYRLPCLSLVCLHAMQFDGPPTRKTAW